MDMQLKNRLKGMVLGQFLGDAASLGVHWIYNTKDIESMYPNGLQGFEILQRAIIMRESRDLTHYGDASWVLLEALAEKTTFDAASFGTVFVEKMDPSRIQGYFDAATRGTLENSKIISRFRLIPLAFRRELTMINWRRFLPSLSLSLFTSCETKVFRMIIPKS